MRRGTASRSARRRSPTGPAARPDEDHASWPTGEQARGQMRRSTASGSFPASATGVRWPPPQRANGSWKTPGRCWCGWTPPVPTSSGRWPRPRPESPSRPRRPCSRRMSWPRCPPPPAIRCGCRSGAVDHRGAGEEPVCVVPPRTHPLAGLAGLRLGDPRPTRAGWTHGTRVCHSPGSVPPPAARASGRPCGTGAPFCGPSSRGRPPATA